MYTGFTAATPAQAAFVTKATSTQGQWANVWGRIQGDANTQERARRVAVLANEWNIPLSEDDALALARHFDAAVGLYAQKSGLMQYTPGVNEIS